jgi:hypothetical protein
MYPVAPASLILFVKRISDFLFLTLLVTLHCVEQFASIAEETQSGWRMVV